MKLGTRINRLFYIINREHGEEATIKKACCRTCAWGHCLQKVGEPFVFTTEQDYTPKGTHIYGEYPKDIEQYMKDAGLQRRRSKKSNEVAYYVF